jgi:aspartate aminotransferase-like enzyme/ribosomal protein S18 acetylase RimI-like enzyme
MDRDLVFKIADEDSELVQIHELNYETFVEEIPQHTPNSEKTLVDKFHSENIYIICLEQGELLGMLAVRDARPFSLDKKLESLDSYLPPADSVCEIRLLSVRPERRGRRVVEGLFRMLARHCEDERYDLALISATPRQARLYKNLGFTQFGPEVGSEGALYQPMYLTPESYLEFKERSKLLTRITVETPGKKEPLNLLPGPVEVSATVKEAASGSPVSHRSGEFIDKFNRVRRLLLSLTGASRVEILMGSGTLGNDAVAAQLGLTRGAGLIVTNGEFGERLLDHARRLGLQFESIEYGWGEEFKAGDIERALENNPHVKWLWAVHSETSAGVLNDLFMLKAVCGAKGVLLALDCVSSLGTAALDLADVYMASGVSGKGLASYPGLAMVFHNREILPAGDTVPRYMDLHYYTQCGGVPFTVNSNLVSALEAALLNLDPERRYGRLLALSLWLRGKLTQAGFNVVGAHSQASPSLVTIALPKWLDSITLGEKLEGAGYLISYRSAYLRERNWAQISLMGGCGEAELLPLIAQMEELIKPLKSAL